MSDRQPATDKGTADRIEADNGGYWVRLVTKQAMKREGVCMGNCLDSQSYGEEFAGNEEMVSTGFWSLRKVDGLSHMLVKVVSHGMSDGNLTQAKGPKNNQPSTWSCRQLRHLAVAFRNAGATLRIREGIALTGEDGRTWRPDKAPQDLKDAIEARRKAEAATTYEIPYGRMMVRPAGSDAPFVEVELVGGGSSGFLPLSPASDVRDQAPDLSDQEVAYRTGPDQPFQVMRGQERHEAISAAIMRGLIARYHMTNDVETVTVRAGRDPSQFTTQNEDGTHRLNLGDLVFPTVTATSYDIEEFGVSNTMTFRIAPAPGRVVRRARLVPGDQPAFGFGAGGGGGVITERSSEFRMTSIQMSPAIRALADGMFVRDDAGPDPRPDRSVGGGSVIMAPGGWSSTRYGPSWSEG